MWILAVVSTGDVCALQELSGCVSAFRETGMRGLLPLHTAAVQPQQEILSLVLQGESLVQQAGCEVYIIKDICILIKPSR